MPESFEVFVLPGLLLAMAVSVPLLRAALGRAPARDVAVLGQSSALAFLAADVPHVLMGVISPVYLLDAAVEAGFAIGWARARG